MQPRQQIQTVFPIQYLLPFIILVEGFASIAVEILTIRQLLPVAGGSVIVTSLIIGVFLLFLALGYERGGRVVDNLHQKLRRNFVISAVWVGIGLSYVFIIYFFGVIERLMGSHLIFSLIFYLLLVLAPAIYVLGQTLPITMNIVRQDKTAGVIAGKALGISTIGSFLGAILTTVVLMQFVGVAWTVFIVYLSLILLALFLSQDRRHLQVLSVITVISGVIIYFMNIYYENLTFTHTNAYANYQVITSKKAKIRDDEKYLIINNVLNSYINKNKEGFPYIETLAKVIYDDLQYINSDILMLGAGGFTLSQKDAGGNHFTYVDIDSQLKKVVVPEFLAEIKDQLIIDDARHYLNVTDKKYDVIVIDVYSSLHAIPAYLLTREFMQSLKDHLKPDGYALFNIIGVPTYTDRYSRRVDNTIRSVFGSCAVIPDKITEKQSNLVYVCNNKVDANDNIVYTDNKNSSTMDGFAG